MRLVNRNGFNTKEGQNNIYKYDQNLTRKLIYEGAENTGKGIVASMQYFFSLNWKKYIKHPL